MGGDAMMDYAPTARSREHVERTLSAKALKEKHLLVPQTRPGGAEEPRAKCDQLFFCSQINQIDTDEEPVGPLGPESLPGLLSSRNPVRIRPSPAVPAGWLIAEH